MFDSAGLCNGNIGIVKSSMAEMTDETNEARAFALLPMCWTIGQVIAPVIGGYLANPVERYPAIFGGSRLFEEYRYLLPCLVAGAFPVMGALIGSVVLKEVRMELPACDSAENLGTDSRSKEGSLRHCDSAKR